MCRAQGIFRIPPSLSKLRKLTTGFDAGLLSLPRASGSAAPAACDATRPSCVQCLSAQLLGDFEAGRSSTPGPPAAPAPVAFDAYILAGAIKQYMRQLPEPLLTFDLYDKWAHAASLYVRLLTHSPTVRVQYSCFEDRGVALS